MDRHGSLIWWLVCIGLVFCWVWNFQSAVESPGREMAALPSNPISDLTPPELHQPLRMPQTAKSIERADKIVHQMAKPLAAASPNVEPEPRQSTAQTTRQPALGSKSKSMPFIDLGEDSSTKFTNLDQIPQVRNDFSIEQKEMVAANSPGTDGWLRNENFLQEDKQRISNPFFHNATEIPQEAIQATDPVLTLEKSLAPAANDHRTPAIGALPQVATQEKPDTDFVEFDNRKRENTFQVSPANQFVSNSPDLLPITTAAPKTNGNATTIQQCVNHIEYGKSLARRGAAFAAREEFYSALRLIAQSNDAQSRSTEYTSALREAITALNEADDFYSEIAHEGIDVNVAHVVDAHQSKVIPMDRAEGMSSMIAIQAYFEFARQRMGDAFGENVIASEALYSLGKLFTVAAAHDLTGNPLDYSKSIVMHYAAIDSDSSNFRSSNELGVLMARNGRLEKARDLFRDSLLVERLPQTWRNLAVVHERIANASRDSQVAAENRDLAQKAVREYELSRQSNQNMSPKVQWVTPEQFEQTAPPEFNEPRTAQVQPDPAQTQPTKPGMFSRWKDMF